jgi:alkyldihydroxyacetonephosphate synthase
LGFRGLRVLRGSCQSQEFRPVDTFETSITWDKFQKFYEDILAPTRSAIRSISDQEVDVSGRLTHVYPDGGAPYFTDSFLGSNSGDLASITGPQHSASHFQA